MSKGGRHPVAARGVSPGAAPAIRPRVRGARHRLAQWEEGHWSLGGHGKPITVWDNHLAFEVDDIEAWKRKLGGLGIEFVVGTMGEGFMKQIYFKDPSGNMVELVQHLREHWWKAF